MQFGTFWSRGRKFFVHIRNRDFVAARCANRFWGKFHPPALQEFCQESSCQLAAGAGADTCQSFHIEDRMVRYFFRACKGYFKLQKLPSIKYPNRWRCQNCKSAYQAWILLRYPPDRVTTFHPWHDLTAGHLTSVNHSNRPSMKNRDTIWHCHMTLMVLFVHPKRPKTKDVLKQRISPSQVGGFSLKLTEKPFPLWNDNLSKGDGLLNFKCTLDSSAEITWVVTVWSLQRGKTSCFPPQRETPLSAPVWIYGDFCW